MISLQKCELHLTLALNQSQQKRAELRTVLHKVNEKQLIMIILLHSA